MLISPKILLLEQIWAYQRVPREISNKMHGTKYKIVI